MPSSPPRAVPVLWRATTLAFAGALVLAVSTGACSGPSRSASPTSAAVTTTTAAPRPNNLAIGFREENFVDTSRPTPANNGAPGSPSRALPTLVYYPADGPAGSDAGENAPIARTGRPFPLIVLAHGLGGFASAYGTLLTTWARAGFIAAAPTFPLTHFGTPGGLSIGDYNNQPADMSFVITQLLQLNADPTSPLAGTIDPKHIAVAGHSLGAMTVLGLMNTCCRDPRISAAVVLAGQELRFGTGNRFFVGPAVPVLFVHGTKDKLVNYALGQKAFADATSPKFFLTVLGGDHIVPYLGSPSQPMAHVVEVVTTDFLDGYEKADAGALGHLSQDGTVAGVATVEASP